MNVINNISFSLLFIPSIEPEFNTGLASHLNEIMEDWRSEIWLVNLQGPTISHSRKRA